MDLRSLLGKGALRSAGDDLTLRPQYDQEKLDALTKGLPFPEYEVWKQMKLQPKPITVSQY